ncbi:hypothetical protein Pla100_45620 [Neorhodopirellula pilleata]|uniref:Alpha/beta hydrolase family protein n=1 Tax=Neorhodopirellula pilleata TaxID=2714738 RepID=A0A5C5ZY09_9BACT|nr:hypothetical protein Pla100_45620 [Neorhodopirellula pilleata]
MPSIDRILLIPGLLEPRSAFWPLKRRLQRYPVEVEVWRDRYVFRDTEASIERLAQRIGDLSDTGRYGLVTHSFGDWVARQAIARTPDHRVNALVSIAPVMACGIIPRAIHLVSGNLVPEIRIIANTELASKSLDCGVRLDDGVHQHAATPRRMIIWAACDLGVRRLDVSHLSGVVVHRVAATHLSVVMQPNTHRLIESFFGFKPQRSL